MLICSRLLFVSLAVARKCDGDIAVRDGCNPALGDDELFLLQTVPAKRGTESTLVFEAQAEAEAQDLDPLTQSHLVAVAVAEAEVVSDKTEILHPSTSRVPFMIRMIEFYKRSLEAWPHFTNGVVAYVITTMGDASAQIIQGGVDFRAMEGFDIKRNVALALTASIYSGLILTSWLLALNTALPGFGLRLVMGKLAATQTILQPFVYVPFFFIVHGMFCGQSSAEIRDKIRRDYFDLLFKLWSLFMPSRFLMFLIIPVRYQVLWDSSVAFIWQFALSLMIAKKGQAALKKGVHAPLLKSKAHMPAAVKGQNEDAPHIKQ